MLTISRSLFDDFFFYQYRQEFSQLELYQEVKGINVLSKKPILREDLQLLIHQEVEKIKNEIKNTLLSYINHQSFQIDEKLSFQLTVLTYPIPFKSKIIKITYGNPLLASFIAFSPPFVSSFSSKYKISNIKVSSLLITVV
jgi:hypothetical protein